MKDHLLITVAAVAVAAGAIIFPAVSAAQTPPMAGGYTNAIPIPLDDPQTKAIAGALFKPEGAGPFPAIIYMSDCGGLGDPTDRAQQKAVIDHYVGQGKAVLILDSFTPRGFEKGVCDRVDDVNLFHLRAEDAYAAQMALAAMPDIDGKRVFLQGYSHCASAAAWAVNPLVAFKHDGAAFAGVVAYYPYCWEYMTVSVPTLVLIGDKDDWTPFFPSQSSTTTNSKLCEAKKSRPNFEVVIYPGATHAFTMPMDQPVEVDGHHIAYDERATKDAEARADAFIAAHMTEVRTK
jgi:dienelactone hydrolase